jgi:hypothetical protein
MLPAVKTLERQQSGARSVLRRMVADSTAANLSRHRRRSGTQPDAATTDQLDKQADHRTPTPPPRDQHFDNRIW